MRFLPSQRIDRQFHLQGLRKVSGFQMGGPYRRPRLPPLDLLWRPPKPTSFDPSACFLVHGVSLRHRVCFYGLRKVKVIHSWPNPPLNSDPAASGQVLPPRQFLHPFPANRFSRGWSS